MYGVGRVMERTSAVFEMVQADLARLAECWSRARSAEEDLPRLENVLGQDLGNAAERVFVVERRGRSQFRFGVASDRILLRLGFDVSGRDLTEHPPWPDNITAVLERGAITRASVELMITAETSHGEEASLAVHLFPVADAERQCSGFIGFAHAFGRSSDGRDDFGVIASTQIEAAVLSRPQSSQVALASA
jgi:hypothetical protein